MAKLILINGKKRSGKDYFAKLVQMELLNHNKSSKIMSFADPIKDIISTTLDISKEDLEKYKNDDNSYGLAVQSYQSGIIEECNVINFRGILQRFGTEAMKQWFGEDVWVKLLKQQAEKLNYDYIIVPDFRFLCEDVGDITVKIKNDDVECIDNHRSENELNDYRFDCIIDNTGYRDITVDVKLFVDIIIQFEE